MAKLSNPEQFIVELKKAVIINTSPELGIFFTKAIRPTIKSLKSDLENIKYRYNNLIPQTSNLKASDDYFEDEGMELQCQIQYLQQTLASIAAMRIVNLYHDFEIKLKMILTEHLNANPSDLKDSTSQNSLLKSHKIIVRKLVGQKDADDVRKISNNIKHNPVLKQKNKSIPEFRNAIEFTYQNCEQFFDRVEPGINNYLTAISEQVCNYVIQNKI